jgi:hypothetical protein
VQDRSLIRSYLGLPVTEEAMVILSDQMNSTASVDSHGVVQIQAWLDEIITLEQTHADEVDSGTAHLGSATSYEGARPGVTLTRDDKLSQAGPAQWDTGLDKVKYEFGTNSRASVQGQREERINTLVERIATALSISKQSSSGGILIRS